jgi:cation transport regulator ChaC
MSTNTFEENQRKCQLDQADQVWLFGYGSLIYLVDFPYLESKPASISGWSRRFWQGSHDHRGTEANPGRVVTLIEEANAICGGVAYLVEAPVFKQLDIREKNGYLRVNVEMIFDDGLSATGLTYIATPENEAYLGPASELAIAQHICRSKGPSGANSDYLLELAQALRELGLHDQHVFDIETHIVEILKQ